MIKINNLNKTNKGKVILKDVSFEVPRGVVCAFIGENGAGKSTTIKSITGLYPYDSGKITINDVNVSNIDSHNFFGYIPEKENFPKTPALTFLTEMSSFYNLSKKEIQERILKYAKLFGISEKLGLSLHKMSSGQRKKVMVIQALIHDPILLIADEPTENLDPDNREKFYKILNEYKENNKTVFICTHNLDEISTVANYIVVINSAEIVFQGPIHEHSNIRELYNQYKETGETHQFKTSKLSNKDRYKILLNNKQITKSEYELLIDNFEAKKHNIDNNSSSTNNDEVEAK